jgi:threonine/homoserine/homoserine lactone efflux protein
MLISYSSLLVFVTGAAILLVIPGPAVTCVISRSIGHGRAAGLVSVMGIVTGTLCHVVCCGSGDFRAAGLFGGGVSVRKVSRRGLPDLSWN